jgi:hypothetical protein
MAHGGAGHEGYEGAGLLIKLTGLNEMEGHAYSIF